ncbi:hypothetical protein ABBQ38_013456 [Trebouxia sp. C0009 RCD-2024]
MCYCQGAEAKKAAERKWGRAAARQLGVAAPDLQRRLSLGNRPGSRHYLCPLLKQRAQAREGRRAVARAEPAAARRGTYWWGSLRWHQRKQHVRTAEEAAEMYRVMHPRATAAEQKQEQRADACCCFFCCSCSFMHDALRVAWQQAVAAPDLQKEAEDAAKVRKDRQQVLVDNEAAKEQRAQAREAVRAVAKAEAAAARKVR